MTAKRRKGPTTPLAEYERAVAVYTAAGGQETVQRVVTAISRLDRRLDVFYRQQFADLGLSHGEWTVLQTLALEGPEVGSTPSKLADIAGLSPSAMTHRLDKMTERGLILRAPDPSNRTRVKISLTDAGWQLFRSAVVDAESVESGLLAPLDDREQRRLVDLLEKLVAGL
jgi:DNA-binding MarR family transcriptional regulator